MLLSVFSFSPSASGASDMVAETATGTGVSSSRPGRDFAEFVRASQPHGEQQNSQGQQASQQTNSELDRILKQFSVSLGANTELTAEQLEIMVASVDAVLLQTSAASYPAELTEALENISAILSQLQQQLAASAVEGEAVPTVAFGEVIEAVIAQAPESEGSQYSAYAATVAAINGDNDTKANFSARTEDEDALPTNLFSDLQSKLAANDPVPSEPLNALLALYQAPSVYQQAAQSAAVNVAAAQQPAPQWVQHAQAVNDGPEVDVPEITLPGQAVASADTEAVAPVAAAENKLGAQAVDNTEAEGVFEEIEQATRRDSENAEAKPVNQARVAETLAPLSQFAQALQADASAPITQAAFAPVVEAQSGVTNVNYNANAEVHVPRGVVSDQVQVALKHANAEGLQRITIQLDPHELGRIDVRMDVDRDGTMRIAFTADRPETIDMLQREARVLERVLQDSGMKTDTGNMEFHLRQQPNQQHAGGQFQGGQGEGYQPGAEGDADMEHTANAETEVADELAALGATEHTSHDVHYGVNVQV